MTSPSTPLRPLTATSALLLSSAVLAALITSTAQAHEPSAAAQSPDIISGQQAGARYLSGGVDKEDVQRIRHEARVYNLHLVFSEGRKNDYAADVHLRIMDAHGRQVLALRDAGPMTDVALASGRYTVKARFGSMERDYAVDLKKGEPLDLYLHFPHDAPMS